MTPKTYELELKYIEAVLYAKREEVRLGTLKRSLYSIGGRIDVLKAEGETEELVRARDKLRYVQKDCDDSEVELGVLQAEAEVALLRFKAELEME